MNKLDAYEAALRSIENLNNGPDLASGDYRCREAAAIAQDALDRNVGDETFARIIYAHRTTRRSGGANGVTTTLSRRAVW